MPGFGAIKPLTPAVAPAAAAPAAAAPAAAAPKPMFGGIKAPGTGVMPVATPAPAAKLPVAPKPAPGTLKPPTGGAAPIATARGVNKVARAAAPAVAKAPLVQGTGGAGFAQPVVKGRAGPAPKPKVAAKPKAAAKPKKAAVSNKLTWAPQGAPTDKKHYREGGQYRYGGQQYFYKNGQLHKVTGAR